MKSKTVVPGNGFSKEYFELVLDFSKQLKSIVRKISKDEILKEKTKYSLASITDVEGLFRYFIRYDLARLLKILNHGAIDKTSLQTFVAAMLCLNVDYGDSNEDIWDYEQMSELFYSDDCGDVVELIIETADDDNPFPIDLFSTNENSAVPALDESGWLLPAFLKINGHPLFDEYATTLFRFATILAKADNVVTKEEEQTLQEIFQMIHNPLPEAKSESIIVSDPNKKETLEDVLNELDELIGLTRVKQEVNTLINYIKIQKEREKAGLKSSQISYHCVFTGSPGTGKTTIARIIAKIYMHLGVLHKGHLVETDRSGLVGEYLGQTAIKVNKTVLSALDGVLFIDEAYSMIEGNQDSFGKEAVATLIKRMEDDREKLIVILAGYTDEMKSFVDSNPGLESRFNRYIEFPDYTPDEMGEIFALKCNKLDYKLTGDAEKKLAEILNSAFANRDKSFGNGRFVRNIFEKAIERQANRIAGVTSLTKEVLITISIDDSPVM